MHRGRFLGFRSISAAALLTIAGVAVPARAGSFTRDGAFQLDPLAVTRLGFEEAEAADAGSMPQPDEPAREGGHVVNLPQFQGIDGPVTLPPSRAASRVSVWIGGAEVTVSVDLTYTQHQDEVAALYPTGRVAGDGWVEVANDHLCVDGRVPPIPVDRSDVTDCLENRLKFLFGPYLARALDLPAVRLARSQMRLGVLLGASLVAGLWSRPARAGELDGLGAYPPDVVAIAYVDFESEPRSSLRTKA